MAQKEKAKQELVEEIKLLQKRIVELEITDTESKQQQQQQQQQQIIKRLATVVRDSNDAITLKDFDGRITAWNHGAELMYGYSEKEALQMNVQQLTPPDKEAEHAEFIRRVMAGETISSFETKRVTKDGRILDVWLTVTKVLDDIGKPIGIATTERDITERKQIEKELKKVYDGLDDKIRVRTKDLQQSEENLRMSYFYARSLLESSLDPLVTISREGKITDVNEATVKATGISREKLIETDFSYYFTEPEKAQQGYQEVFTKGFVSNYPLTIRSKDGKLTDVLYNATVYKDNRGNVLGVFAAARDVTEFNNLQNRLARTEKLAIIGKLASSVAHELRNPLGVMQNAIYYLNMQESVKNNPDIKENLELVSGEITNSNKVIGDLLEFSHIKKPALKLEDINLIIRETLIRVRVPADIKIVTELAEDLPQIQADALQIQQVFYNLASNAIQAMEEGGTLTVSSCMSDEETIAIVFKDTGSGIPKENLKKILDPLFSTKAKGTGLGLSVVTSLVEGHYGRLEIASEVGKGSAFIVKLPINGGG